MSHLFRHPRVPRTAEYVTSGHPDKYVDRVADATLDAIIAADQEKDIETCRSIGSRVAIEGVVKDRILVLMGEVTCSFRPDVKGIARQIWEQTGYGIGSDLVVFEHIQQQSPEIGDMSRSGGAGDQGIMAGFASDETPEFMPLEYILARRVTHRLAECWRNGRGRGVGAINSADSITWLRADGKSQVTIDADGRVRSVVLAAQHDDSDALVELVNGVRMTSKAAKEELYSKVILPALAEYLPDDGKFDCTINGVGAFTIGGPPGDAGEVGRKIVVDAYGPGVPVGGGAYSGKDPTKVDRSAAYMARHIAKTIVAHRIGNARECVVHIAYAIGKHEPEMVTAVTDIGEDLGAWVRDHFKLSPWEIIETLDLWKPNGWSYQDTAEIGHYGHDRYPWERIARLS